jgi:formylglycine-generating enzyme required for sulfatase activity
VGVAAKIFISYRRDDDPNGAARVRDGLAAKFGKTNLFMDVDNLLAGQRFDEELGKALKACDVLIAVIGPRWMDLLKAKSVEGQRDYVREEIAEALKRRIVVIPVLVGRERSLPPLPSPGELPEDLRDLVHYQKHDVVYEHFGRDIAGLIAAIITVRRTGERPRTPRWGWVGLAGAGLMAFTYTGAYYLGAPVPWPSSLRAAGEGTVGGQTDPKRVAALKAEEQRAEVERHRLAALKAEEDRKRLEAEAEAKRKADEAARRDPALQVKPGSGQSFRDCPDCPEMVVVPAGEFLMGSPAEEDGRDNDEGPVHKVSIQRPFAVGKYSVTRGEFAAFVRETGHKTDGGCNSWDGKAWKLDPDRSWRSPGFAQDDRHPVVCVNWDDAKAYTRWLSTKTGKPYRLPSEAEREYATRGVTAAAAQPRYHFGNDAGELCKYANGADQTAKKAFPGWSVAPCEDGFVYTSPVGSYRSNAFGLYDMHGNVWNWTEDCWNGSYEGAPSDGSARTSGECGRRALRGGSWFNNPQVLRAADRNRYFTVDRLSTYGFRVGRTLVSP